MATTRSDGAIGKDVTINEVASVIHSGYFLFTGSCTVDGYPIVFSLDGIYPEPEDEMQRNALIYIASLPTSKQSTRLSADKNLQYCFVLDRRKSSWTSVRKVLNLISSFTRPVKEVVLLQPTGFIQRRFSTSESNKLPADFPTLQTILFDDTDALVRKYGADNLCVQLGGSVSVNADSFIQQRKSIDSLEVNCLDLEERVKDLLLLDAQSDFDIPNDVASTEAMLNEHAEIKTNLSDEITNIKSQGEIVLQCFKNDTSGSLQPTQQMIHIQEVQKLTTRLEDLHEAIRDYWEKEESKLQEFMKLREFHDEFKSLQQNLNKLSEALTNVKDYISSVEEATSNGKRLAKIETESQSLLGRAKWVAKVWSSKMGSTDSVTLDTVGPKCEELQRLHDLCVESLKHKQRLANKQTTLYTQLDAAQQWLADEITHPVDEEASKEERDKQLKHIDFQITIGKFLEVLNFEEFMRSYSTALTEESQATVAEVKDKVMELMVRYEQRRASIYEAMSKLTIPFQQQTQQHPTKVGVMKRRKSSFAFFGKDKTPTANTDDEVSPDPVFTDRQDLPIITEGSKSGRIRRMSSSKRGKNDGQGSLNSESSSTISGPTTEERTTSGQSVSFSFTPASPTNSSVSRGDSSYSRGDDSRTREDMFSEDGEHNSETSDQLTEMARPAAENANDSTDTLKPSLPNRGRRGSLKAIKGIFTRKKSKSSLFDDTKSEQSLNVNTGVFEKSLTLEEEKSMAKARSELIGDLVLSEQRYTERLKHIVLFYMRPISEGGDSVSTDLYANQSLIFSNLEEIYDFNAKIFLHELRESKDSPSLIGAVFKNKVKMLSKYKDYCTSRSRAEVLLRQLTNDTFLAERVKLQGHDSKLCAQLLLPAKRIVYYNKFLQAMYNNLKDDLEAQRDISLVMSLLADTVQTADDLLHQVNIDGYHDFISYLEEVDLATHGSLLHQGRVLVAHEKKSQHTKPSDFKAKLKPRHVFLYEKCLLFCRIHEDNDRIRPYSYMHAIKLSDSVLEKCSEKSTKFVFRCNNESYLIQCEMTDQTSWYENIQFALNNCDSKQEELSPLRAYNFSSPKPSRVNHAPQVSIHYDDDVILTEDPDVDMIDSNGDIDIMESVSKRHNSGDDQREINGNSLQQYMLKEDFDNELLLGRGDIVECVTIRKDMMQTPEMQQGLYPGWDNNNFV